MVLRVKRSACFIGISMEKQQLDHWESSWKWKKKKKISGRIRILREKCKASDVFKRPFEDKPHHKVSL